MATTLNRTFFGGSTAPGSGVYPEDLKVLKVFRNYAETDYDPLANSDTSIYIPTVEKVDSSGANIQVTIQKILASGGYPVLVYHNEEYQYVMTGGTPSKYVFMCLSDLSTFKRAEVDVSTGAVAVSSSTTAAVQYIGRSSHNIFHKISNAIVQNTLPVIVDDSAYYQLSYAWNGMTRFTRVDETDGTLHILSIDSDDTITEAVVSAGAGGTIYPSLQSAIADASNLAVGAIFETNGFHTSGDGGAARYLVSSTGTANGYNIIELSAGKYAILQVHDFIHPECYGAKGDNSTDNTAVFDAIFSDANVKSIMLSANKTYKIQFKNWTLRNITLVGADKMSSRLSQMNTNLNKPFATIGIGVEIGNICFICGGGNTQQTGLFHFGNDENGAFQPFIGSIIHDIYAYCVQNIIGFDFSYTQNGSHTIRIEHCKLEGPGIGIRVTNLNDLTHQSYLSNFYFNDIIVNGPYNYGFSFDKSQAGGMMISHGLLTQCSVQLSRNGSCGYKLSYGDYSILNPCVFVENTSGEVYSVELDFDKLYVPVVPNGILNVSGGILEGTIKNKEFLHSINWQGVDFVEEQNFPEGNSGHRAYSRHLNTTPNSIFTKSFYAIKTGITLTNGTSSEDSGIYGKTIKVTVTDFGLSQVTIKIPIDLPDIDKLTSVFLFELSNGYKFLTTGSLPSVALTNSSNESILDALGPDPNGKRNRITMDDLEKYYALVGTFDISAADRTKTWYLQVNIPTSFSNSVENAHISILGINLYEGYVNPVDININKIGAIAKDDLPNGVLTFGTVADTNSSAIQVWGGDNTSPMGTYKTIGNISVPAGHIADITIAGSLQHNLQGNGLNTIVFQLSEQNSLDNDAVAQPVYVREGSLGEISLSVRFVVRNTSSSTKTYYIGAYNINSVQSGDIIELANNISTTQGLRITLVSYGVNSNA